MGTTAIRCSLIACALLGASLLHAETTTDVFREPQAGKTYDFPPECSALGDGVLFTKGDLVTVTETTTAASGANLLSIRMYYDHVEGIGQGGAAEGAKYRFYGTLDSSWFLTLPNGGTLFTGLVFLRFVGQDAAPDLNAVSIAFIVVDAAGKTKVDFEPTPKLSCK